jgi:competence ComEA-like helix-hairpin-helix protein
MFFMKRAALIVCPLFLLSVARAQDDIPAGPGKDTVQRVCTACHDLGAVQTMNGNKDIWQSVADDMRSRGADGTDEDFKTIVTYLSKYFGPTVNVNTAEAKDLETLDLTTAEAAAIVKYRTDKGNFKVLADLSKVPNLDMSKLEPLKKRIKF